MSMPRAVRHINEIRILDTLFRKGAMSRADLGRELGLMRSTAGNLVTGLAREGLLRCDQDDQGDTRGSRMGRPGNLVELNGRHSLFLGAEIGIGRITVVAVDLNARVAHREVAIFDASLCDPESVVETLVSAIGQVMDAVGEPTIRGLNVAVAGLIDRGGNVMRAPILGWSNVPLTAMLKARLPRLRLTAENDANAFAMAELYRDGSKPAPNALFLFMDAGIGGGIVSEGQLIRGERGYAGEIGHMPMGQRGFASASALPGSLESFVGRKAVLDSDRHYGGMSKTIEQFEASLSRGTASALAAIDDWAEYLGRGLATLVAVFDPSAIVLGGPVAALFPYCERNVVAAMRQHLLSDHPIPGVEVSSLGADAPAIGAALMLHRRTLSFDAELIFNGIQPVGSMWGGQFHGRRYDS